MLVVLSFESDDAIVVCDNSADQFWFEVNFLGYYLHSVLSAARYVVFRFDLGWIRLRCQRFGGSLPIVDIVQ